MTQRTILGIAAAVVATSIVAVHLTAQAPAAPSRHRRVWTGTIDDRQIILNAYDTTPIRRPVRFFQDVHVSFTFVSEDDPDRPGLTKWVSRRLTWQAYAHSSSSVQGTECRGSDSLDLGPAEGHDMVTPAQEARLKIRCTDWTKGTVWAFILSPNPKVRLPIINEMANCEPTRRWTEGGVRYTLSVSPTEPQASFRFAYFDSEHAPVPGRKVKIRGESNVLGRWRFVLDSSRLRGYATNADISSAFFDLYPDVSSMRDGKYGTLDPDLVFDPALSQEQGSEWKPPTPDRGPRKWSVIESTDATSVNRVELELTAMDFGAHGEVRAYISPTCGGGWRQVPVEGGGGTFVKYPKDDDGNFMSDLEADYRKLAALSDDDAQPAGEGPGDGFTAFEEYRGFVLPILTSCRSPLARKHVRTSPKQKNFFIHVSDPVLSLVALGFADTSGLHVRGICPENYVDNNTRIVNFTMHTFPGQLVIGEGLRGARLTQAQPQHGLYLVNEQRGDGVLGQTIPVDPALGLGPPRNVSRVTVDIPAIYDAYRVSRYQDLLTIITHHELGHAVSIQHHGDKNHVDPMVLLTTPGCIVGMIEGTADGQPVCKINGVVLQGQQNSGNASCPMKYLHWSWYVPRPSALIYSRMVDFRPDTSWNWQRNERPARLPGYAGPVYRYRKDLDEPPDPLTMKFCTSPTGTGINALPGDQNHAGDADRRPSCSRQLRVRDIDR